MKQITKIVLVVAVFITMCASAMKPEVLFERSSNLFRFTHPFVPDDSLRVSGKLKSVDIERIRVLDVQSIVNGANISAPRKSEFFSMLSDSDSVAREFGLFLDSALFPDNYDFVQVQGERISSITHEILKTNDADKLSMLLQSACNFAAHQVRAKRVLDYSDFISHVMREANALSDDELSSSTKDKLKEILAFELEETACRFSFKTQIFETVCASIKTEIYRKAVVSFLAAFEHQKTIIPNLIAGFMFKGEGCHKSVKGYVGDEEVTITEEDYDKPKGSYVCRPCTTLFELNQEGLLLLALPLKEKEK